MHTLLFYFMHLSLYPFLKFVWFHFVMPFPNCINTELWGNIWGTLYYQLWRMYNTSHNYITIFWCILNGWCLGWVRDYSTILFSRVGCSPLCLEWMHLIFTFKQARPWNDHCKKGLYIDFLHSDKPQVNPYPGLQFLSSISVIRKPKANDWSEFLNHLFFIVRTCICSHFLLLNTETE